jgi:putative alpha-1,2-mannosidase
MFAGTGFWDTFRALYPFLNLSIQVSTLKCRKDWPMLTKKADSYRNGAALDILIL